MDFLNETIKNMSETTKTAISAQLSNYLPRQINHDFTAYFAVTNKTIAATAFLTIIERPANPSIITGKFGIISNVYTLPKYRKMGIATNLINLLIEEGKTNNLSYIELAATKDGKPVYEKLGFTIKQSNNYTDMKLNLISKII